MLQLFGRFHLVVLHLPIGFLLLAFLLETAARRSPGSPLRPAVRFALFWGMLSALASAALGWMLAQGENDYDPELLGWHMRLGFATAGLSVALYFTHVKMGVHSALQKLHFPLFLLTVAALAAAGHQGGSLTHGSSFLFKTEKKQDSAALTAATLDSAEVYAGLIQPIFKEKCGGCHNPEKKKGGLVLLTKEDFLKGGDLGAPVNLEKLAESPLLSINFPLENEYHMPPKGKKQLTPLEKKILEWWTYAGAPFDKKVAACKLPDSLRTLLLQREERKASPLAALKLEPVSDKKLLTLREDGIAAYPLAAGSPFVQVLLADRQDLTPDVLKKIKKVGKNVVQLDLGSSSADDALLANLAADLPHLNRLSLDQTAVTDAGLAHLSKLSFLEYLNLYKTQVTDAGLAQLKGLKNLRTVYLWQTGVTEQGVAALTAALPDLLASRGMVEGDSTFGEVALKPPAIEAGKELFTDTVHVSLKLGFGKAKIHYTLDGSDPDSTDAVFEKTLVLDSSAEVRAIALKGGWKPSEVAARQFFKIRHQPQSVALASPPNEKYKGAGGKTLADLKKGSTSIGDGNWIGYEGAHLAATLDLGKVTGVSKVTVGSLENTASWIFFPKGLRISTSADGRNFKKVKVATYPTAAENKPAALKNFSEKFVAAQARFVRVEVLSNLKNPKWHPNAGKKCWVFVDEILVE